MIGYERIQYAIIDLDQLYQMYLNDPGINHH